MKNGNIQGSCCASFFNVWFKCFRPFYDLNMNTKYISSSFFIHPFIHSFVVVKGRMNGWRDWVMDGKYNLRVPLLNCQGSRKAPPSIKHLVNISWNPIDNFVKLIQFHGKYSVCLYSMCTRQLENCFIMVSIECCSLRTRRVSSSCSIVV